MKVFKNYLYNTSYQLLALILPLITGPYISRVLGPNGVGINTYTYNIANWFVMIGSIGIAYYGNKQIASSRTDIQTLSINFFEIFIMKAITVAVSLVVYMIFIHSEGKYFTYLLVQSAYLIAAAIDISWFFMGIEDFRKTVTRNFFIKIISLVLILTLVKSKGDLIIYISILSFSTLIGNLTLWPFLRRNIVWVDWKSLKPFRHFKGAVELFLPLVAIQLYTSLNKIILGALDSTVSAGFYDKSDSIVKMALTISTSLGTVMMPHAAKIFSEGNNKKVNDLLYKSFSFISCISFPLSFGLSAIALKFGSWFYGKGFDEVGKLMFIESILIVVISWAGVTGNQFLVPTNQVKKYSHSVFLGAIVNTVLCIPLVKSIGIYGALVAMIFSEISVTAYQVFSIRTQVDLKLLFRDTWKYIMASLLMFIVVFYINVNIEMNFFTLLLQVVVGIVLYCICLVLFRTRILKDIINFVRK
ncbi:polysaccharide biosynthesis C-terminal domain-containing protein [Limosilactobacillus ingluviei]|uniref:Uncharacterized protein n=1 Tax=Limosilactobacillus ingluviei TaxID=148604 RepID=A0A0R2GXT8_9LACO|nr:polysaccharide biosynthesis C-terminal domain-containing protein [Limosilactobacillus ingluviei]KRN45520.1 hypothetical protein IV41_GL000738 [Limosilactobacillus ingluviei]